MADLSSRVSWIFNQLWRQALASFLFSWMWQSQIFLPSNLLDIWILPKSKISPKWSLVSILWHGKHFIHQCDHFHGEIWCTSWWQRTIKMRTLMLKIATGLKSFRTRLGLKVCQPACCYYFVCQAVVWTKEKRIVRDWWQWCSEKDNSFVGLYDW